MQQQQMEATQKLQYISKLFLSSAVDVKDDLEEVREQKINLFKRLFLNQCFILLAF